jgi:segregation and condensation protein B
MSEETPDAETAAPRKKGKRKPRGKQKAETPDLLSQVDAQDAPDAEAPPETEASPKPEEQDAPPAESAEAAAAREEEEAAAAAAASTEAADEPAPEPVDRETLARTVEALLFAAEEPIAPREIARASGSDSATIRKVLKEIKERYDQQRQPWDIAEVANGFRMVTRPEFYPAVQRLKNQTAQRKLTQAALETLALIAYRQPIGRAEVESVRGVGAGPVLRQLLEKKLIKIAGRGTGVGQPLLYGTTDYFLEHFGLKSTQELPKPGEFKNT